MLVAPGQKLTPRRFDTKERGAPLAGLNTRLSPQAIGENGHALRLDNWICRLDGLHVRKGWTKHGQATGPVKSLLTYKSSVFGRADDNWTGAIIKNEGGMHLVASGDSGEHDPIWFNGRAWQSAPITGVDRRKLRGAIRHGERLFFHEAGSLRLWHLGIDAIGGDASLIPLDMLFAKGGTIVAIGSTTVDGAVNGNDQLVIVTDKGEVAVYAGDNPQDPAKWGLAGVFETSKPVGPRCLFRLGTSLGLLTDKGLLSVAAMLAVKASERDAATLSAAIDMPGAVSGIDSESALLTLVHAGAFQYALDPETKGWSRLTGLDATCWAETADGLYFGRTDGTVARYDGFADGWTVPCSGNPIHTLMVEGFAKYGTSGSKQFTRVRPVWTTARPYVARMELLVDCQDVPERFAAANEGSPDWDWSHFASIQTPVEWSKPITTRLGPWRGIAGRGSTAALIVGAKWHGHEAIWHGHEMEIQAGGHRR